MEKLEKMQIKNGLAFSQRAEQDRKKKKFNSKEFYKHFRIGVEVEGEFWQLLDNADFHLRSNGGGIENYCHEGECARYNEGNCDEDSEANCREIYNRSNRSGVKVLKVWEVGTDGSIQCTRKKSKTYELRTGVIENGKTEKKYIDELASISNEKGNFAYKNETAGTHIHISMQKENPGKMTDYALFIFDTTDFEKFFIRRYISTFRMEKFFNRLENNYCRISKYIKRKNKDVRFDINGSIVPVAKKLEVPKARKYKVDFLAKLHKQREAGRYFWLNTKCLAEGEGIEVRLFPYITSPEGLKKVVEFMQKTFLDYYLMKKTQNNLKILTDFHIEARLKRFRSSQMTPLNELVRISLGISHLRNFWNLIPDGNRYPGGDIQLIMANWYKENPKILIQSAQDKEWIKIYKDSGRLNNAGDVAGSERYNQFWSTLHNNEGETINEIEGVRNSSISSLDSNGRITEFFDVSCPDDLDDE